MNNTLVVKKKTDGKISKIGCMLKILCELRVKQCAGSGYGVGLVWGGDMRNFSMLIVIFIDVSSRRVIREQHLSGKKKNGRKN